MQPTISIITVCFNAERLIEDTFRSVINQSNREFEYIIVDGASHDNTVRIIQTFIKEHGNDIDIRFISEKDNGIYDAMNKGIKLSNGEFCIFLNAGDCFYDNSVIEYICNVPNRDNYILIYGDRVCNYGNYEIITKAFDLSIVSNSLQMPYCHQAAFFKRDYLEKEPYSLKYFIASDYNQCVELYKRNVNYLKVDKIIVSYLIGGLSQKIGKIYIKEKINSRKANGIDNISKIDIVKYFFRISIGSIARKILPKSFLQKIRKRRYGNKV